MTDRDHALQRGLFQLRDALSASLTDADRAQVTELVEAHEFGVALEWILDALVESSQPLPAAERARAEQLAEEMQMTSDIQRRLSRLQG